jgi:hypothetical protein
MNLVERFFANLTADCVREGGFAGVRELIDGDRRVPGGAKRNAKEVHVVQKEKTFGARSKKRRRPELAPGKFDYRAVALDFDSGGGSDSRRPGENVEARYRALVEQIPAVVFMVYLDKGIGEAYVSRQIEQTLGFSQREWLEDPVRWY